MMDVLRLAGHEGVEGGCGALPDVWSQEFSCFAVGAEAEGREFVVGDLQCVDGEGGEDPAVRESELAVDRPAIRSRQRSSSGRNQSSPRDALMEVATRSYAASRRSVS